jgi:hypothetical protein
MRLGTRVAATAGMLLAAAAIASVGGSASASTHAAAKAHAPRVGRFGGIVRPLSTSGARANGIGMDGPVGTPPLIWHGGPMMGTRSTHDKVVITPVYWSGSGSETFAASYGNLINKFLKDAAKDSEKASNVFSTLFEYNGSNGIINYHFTVGAAINIAGFPASGCTVNSGTIYADNTGYTRCIDDDQAISQIAAATAGKPYDNGHIYVLFLPKHVESCFYPGNPSNQACTINHTASAAYCAYHSEGPSNMVYAMMPFPIYKSSTGYSCTDETLGAHIQSPNGNVDADVEISPLSHEISEAVTDPDTTTGWFDSSGYENGDECAYIYGSLGGADPGLFNQTINGHHYLTQEEFSNFNFAGGHGGCLQGYVPSHAPAVTTVGPSGGSIAGGNTVTIQGTKLAGATSVTFGGTHATFKLLDDGKIKATAPAHAAGQVDVRVTTAAGTSPVVPLDHYTYS